MAESLKKKTVKGVGWSAFDNAIKYGVTFVVGIVLARLLSPEDYGLIGISAIFTAVCQALISGGFISALIRKVDATEDDYNTAFITNLCVSLVLYTTLFFCTPLIAKFFERPELTYIVRVTSLGLIIAALALVQRSRLTKKIDFKTQAKITVIASITSGIVGISMAFLGFGVWALVAQHLTSQTLDTFFLWKFNKWIPKFRFSQKSFNYLFGFGWKMMASHFLNTIWTELYQMVVAKFYAPATLGQYSRAKHFSTIFSRNLTNVIQRVSYPVLSSIQEDKTRMVSVYRRIIKTTMFISANGLFFLGAISEPLIHCLIGPKWHLASSFLPIICVNATLYPLHAINLNMLQVQGRSDLFLGLEIVKKCIGIGPLLIGAFIGIIPMLLASVATGVIAFFLNSYYSGKLLNYSSWMQIKDVAHSYMIAVIVALSIYFFKYLPISFWIILPLQIAVGATVFFLVSHYTHSEEYGEFKSLLSPILKKIKP